MYTPKYPGDSFIAVIDRFNIDIQTGIVLGVNGEPVGSISKEGYVRIGVWSNYKTKLINRSHIVWYKATGEWPTMMVDHENRVKTDDRIDNLRELTPLESASNTMHVVGKELPVGIQQRWSRYYVKASANGITKYVGSYDHLQDAVQARLDAIERMTNGCRPD